MRIKDLKLFLVRAELIRTFRISYDVITSVNTVYVKLITDEGIEGWGEAIPAPKITGDSLETIVGAIKYLRRYLVGKELSNYLSIWYLMESLLGGNYSAKAGIMGAVLDALGKYVGLPAYKLLGGSTNEFITDTTISLDEPEVMADEAKEWVKKGFRVLKVKLGGPVDKDIARVRAIREVVGDSVEIRVDANQAWSLRDAVRILPKLNELGVTVVEQPLNKDDYDGLRVLRQLSPITIVLDETVHTSKDAIKVIKLDMCDGINIKLAKCGGFVDALRIAGIVKASNLKLMIGCMAETGLGLSAAAHLVAALGTFDYIDLDADLTLKDQPVKPGYEREGDLVRVSDGAGCGVKVMENKLQEIKL